MGMAEEYVLIAIVLKPHGIRGEVAIKTFADDDERFLDLERVLMQRRGESAVERNVESARLTPQGVLLKFEGVDDRTSAESLRGMELVIPESERPVLPEGRAYFDQVIGMVVVDDETGEVLGR